MSEPENVICEERLFGAVYCVYFTNFNEVDRFGLGGSGCATNPA